MPPIEESGASLEAIRTLESAALSVVRISNNLDAEGGSRPDTLRETLSRSRAQRHLEAQEGIGQPRATLAADCEDYGGELASTLRDLLIQKRASVINRWIDLIFDTYPPEAGKFMRSKKDRIANPVGATIVEGADRLFDWLVGEEQSDEKQLTTCLDDIVRIRAVQEFSASHAVGFVFLLKTAIKEVLGAEMRTHHLVEQFLEFERKIDDLALLAFDNYARCREQLHRIRVMEVKNRTSRLLERAVQKYGVPSDW